MDEYHRVSRPFDLVVEIAAVDSEESCSTRASALFHGTNLAGDKENNQQNVVGRKYMGC